jgi:hypothetical protein
MSFLEPQFDDCGPTLAQYNCVNDLDYPPIGTLSFLSSSLATTGSLTYSTTAGSVTAPLSGSTFVWTDMSIRYTITAAQANNKGASSSVKSTSQASATQSGATTETTKSASGSAASATQSTSNANQQNGFSSLSLAMTVFVAIWRFC